MCYFDRYAVNWTERQTPIDISGTYFPEFVGKKGKQTERFWFIKEQFVKHSHGLLKEGEMFSYIGAHLVNDRWVCTGKPVSNSDIAYFVQKMRLFYMKREYMSIHSVCTYMERNISNVNVQMFFRHMRENWEKVLLRDAILYRGYSGPIKTNKQLIDTVLYSENFHTQEKDKKLYDELLVCMDESLILMSTYRAMHSGYQMNQISRAICELREDNLVILLPDHLRHEWDENCPYDVIR